MASRHPDRSGAASSRAAAGDVINPPLGDIQRPPSRRASSATTSHCDRGDVVVLLSGTWRWRGCPSRSRTEALGRAPPSDEPGASSSCSSSSPSASARPALGGGQQPGSSTSGGIGLDPPSAQELSALAARRSAVRPAAPRRRPGEDNRSRTACAALRLPAPRAGAPAPHQDAAPAVGRGITDCSEQRPPGRVKRSGADLECRLEREPIGTSQPASRRTRTSRSRWPLRTRAHRRPTRWGTPPRSTWTRTRLSVTPRGPLAPGTAWPFASAADSLWQPLLLEREADGVTPGIGQFGQSLGQTEYE